MTDINKSLIIVFDKNQVTQDAFQHIFENTPQYILFVVSDIEEALELTKLFNPDLLIFNNIHANDSIELSKQVNDKIIGSVKIPRLFMVDNDLDKQLIEEKNKIYKFSIKILTKPLTIKNFFSDIEEIFTSK